VVEVVVVFWPCMKEDGSDSKWAEGFAICLLEGEVSHRRALRLELCAKGKEEQSTGGVF
jgi:hypothetical protein